MATASPTDRRPVMIWDGSCGFCARWIERWRALTGSAVEYITSDEAAGRYPELSRERMDQAVQLVTPEGRVLSGAAAVFAALAHGGRRWGQRLYRFVPGFAWLAERLYRFVARHRAGLGRLERVLFRSPRRGP